MDLLVTALLVFAVAALAALGIVVLPWSDAELAASNDALAALGEAARLPVQGEVLPDRALGC